MPETEIRSVHRYRFPVDRDALWAALAGVERYPGWWPWLGRFDGRTLAAGETWRCQISPPLPYRLDCRVALHTVRAPDLVVADVAGDIAGDARLELAEARSPADPGAGAPPFADAYRAGDDGTEADRPTGAAVGQSGWADGPGAGAAGGGPVTEVRVTACLVARSLAARTVARVTPGVARRCHDWVFATAARQFGTAHDWPPTHG